MTRFIMSLDEAVDLVLFAFEHGTSGDILVQKAPACTIQTQAEAVCELFGGDKNAIKVIGIRHGEKMYETLLTNEECAHAVDMGNFYRVPCDKRGLNYEKYFNQGDAERNTLTEFNSNNTRRLNLEETKAKMLEAFRKVADWIDESMLGAVCGKEFDKLGSRDIVKLRNLFNAIKDGFVKAQDVFKKEEDAKPDTAESESLDKLNQELAAEMTEKKGETKGAIPSEAIENEVSNSAPHPAPAGAEHSSDKK